MKVPVKSVAPGQYLGYSLQQTRLCQHLLRAHDGEAVSLEYLEDVAVHRADGTLLLEQSKSALTGNPAADRADDLWKTFANWADLCTAGNIDLHTTRFRLYVAPEKTGNIVELLHHAKLEEAVSDVLIKVKNLLDDKNPSIGCNPQIARFLKAGDEICGGIIARFEFLTEADPIEALRDLLRAFVPGDTLDSFCKVAVGMARDEVDRLIRGKKVPIIAATTFRRMFRAFICKYDLSALLVSSAPAPSAVQLIAVVDTSPLFVRQLRAIEAKADMLMIAVSDFLRTTADKIYWADDGLILRDSLDELDQALERIFKIARDEVEDIHSTLSVEQRGRALYRKCTSTMLPLEGRPLPSHFIPGAFNCLADERKLGWHPQYLALFPGE